MEDNKQVIGIRCHNFGESEQFLYQVLLTYFPKDKIFFIVDELEKTKDFPPNLHKMSLDKPFIEAHGLYDKGNIAWACGDYFYYVFCNTVDAEFYWLIEPDVLLNLDSVAQFFEFFAHNTDEALVTHFSLAPEGWLWGDGAKIILDPPYRCFFPFTRLSKNAINILYTQRQSLSSDFFAGKYTSLFPNDEALLANALIAVGIQPVNISDYFPEQFKSFAVQPFMHKGLSQRYHKNQIIHPVKQLDFYKHAIKNQFEGAFNKRISRVFRQAILDEAELKDLQYYVNDLFSQWMSEEFNSMTNLNFKLKKLRLYFKHESNIHFKRTMIVGNELHFFMGQIKIIAFVFDAKTIKVYKRINYQDSSESTETLIKVWPIQLLDSFELLQQQIEQILRLHENKTAALKKQLLQATSNLPTHAL